MNQQQDPMPYKNGEVCQHDRLKRQCDECWLQWENEDLRTAIELLAVEVAWRRKVGYCPNEVFESVSNNQTCRTALTDAGCSPVEMQDRKDTIIAALQAEVRAWRECRLWTDDNGNWKWYDTATSKLPEATNALNALENKP